MARHDKHGRGGGGAAGHGGGGGGGGGRARQRWQLRLGAAEAGWGGPEELRKKWAASSSARPLPSCLTQSVRVYCAWAEWRTQDQNFGSALTCLRLAKYQVTSQW